MENNTYFTPNMTSDNHWQSDFTIRDHFAGLALQGFCAAMKRRPAPDEYLHYSDMAYRFADAMMKVREL